MADAPVNGISRVFGGSGGGGGIGRSESLAHDMCLLLCPATRGSFRPPRLVALRAAVRFWRLERAAGEAGGRVLLVVDPVRP